MRANGGNPRNFPDARPVVLAVDTLLMTTGAVKRDLCTYRWIQSNRSARNGTYNGSELTRPLNGPEWPTWPSH